MNRKGIDMREKCDEKNKEVKALQEMFPTDPDEYEALINGKPLVHEVIKTSKEIDCLLIKLDAFAGEDQYADHGLPIYDDNKMIVMRSIVIKWIRSQS